MNSSYPDILHQPHLVQNIDSRIDDGVSFTSFLSEVHMMV